MTTRGLLKRIAVIALVMGLILAMRKMSRLEDKGNYYNYQARLCEEEPYRKKKVFLKPEGVRVVQEVIEEPGQDVVPGYAKSWSKVKEYDSATMKAYYKRLATKYDYYARRPWLVMPEEPDTIASGNY